MSQSDQANLPPGDSRKTSLQRWVGGTFAGLLLAAVTAAAVWQLYPPAPHVAYVKLYMPAHPPALPGFEHPEGDIDFARFQRTQFALLRSRPVLNAALRNPRVKEINLNALTKGANPAEWLEDQIRVETSDDPELPRVSMIGDNPEQLKVLVNAVVDAYLSEVVEKDTTKGRLERIDKLKEIKQVYQDRVTRFKDNHRKLAEATGAGQDQLLALKQELAQQEMAAVKADYLKALIELRRLQREAKLAEGQVYFKLTDASLATLRARKVPEGLLRKVDALKDRKFDTGEEFAQELDKLLDRGEVNVYRDLVLAQAEVREGPQAQAGQLKEKIEYQRRLTSLLAKELDEMQERNKGFVKAKIDIEENSFELRQAHNGVNKVSDEIDKLTIELPSPPRVKKWDDVQTVAPDDKPRLKAAGLSGVGAFAAVLLVVGFLDLRARRAR